MTDKLRDAVDWVKHMWPLVANRAPQDDIAIETLILHATRHAKTVEVLKEVRDGLEWYREQSFTMGRCLSGISGKGRSLGVVSVISFNNTTDAMTEVVSSISLDEGNRAREQLTALTALINEHEGVG